MSYKTEITKMMSSLAEQPNALFLGQTVVYPGSILSDTLEGVPMSKRLELPVMEECQMGMSIGLALDGYLPISIYPRIDFLLLAINHLSNHLDILKELSHGEFSAKVIIRTIVGSNEPFKSGPQHSRDHTTMLNTLLKNVRVVKLDKVEEVRVVYENALHFEGSTLVIEEARLY